jgi:hypothetical protein
MGTCQGSKVAQRPKDGIAFGIDPYEHASQVSRVYIAHIFCSEPDHSLDWFKFKGNVTGNLHT